MSESHYYRGQIIPEPGQSFPIVVNRTHATATVLARLDTDVLIEYELHTEKHPTALRVVSDAGVERPVPYTEVPTKWLRVLVESNRGWRGTPVGSQGIPVRSAKSIYYQRESQRMR